MMALEQAQVSENDLRYESLSFDDEDLERYNLAKRWFIENGIDPHKFEMRKCTPYGWAEPYLFSPDGETWYRILDE